MHFFVQTFFNVNNTTKDKELILFCLNLYDDRWKVRGKFDSLYMQIWYPVNFFLLHNVRIIGNYT